MSRRIARSQSGDTIVEVLIAVAIVSSVLVAAFSISNQSLKQIRMAQERSEAQKIAQQLTESLSRIGRESGFAAAANAGPFCKNPAVGNYSTVVYTDTEPACIVNDRYHTYFQKQTSPSGVYKITVWWDGLNNTKQQVVYSYRAWGL